jgi:hypothetical protein
MQKLYVPENEKKEMTAKKSEGVCQGNQDDDDIPEGNCRNQAFPA